MTSSVFIKQLREQVYLPGTLPFLTDSDKLPEIFLTKNVPEDTKNFVLEKLEEQRLEFTKTFFDGLHGSNAIRNPTKPILWNKPIQQIELPDIKNICKNKEEITEEKDEDIVFYTDMDEIYCFNIYQLHDLFKREDNPVNPYTSRPFSDKFIQTFLTRYASKPLISKIDNIQHPDLTTHLAELIEKELQLLENDLIETDNPGIIEQFKIPPNKPEDHLNKCMECKGDLGSNQISSIFRNKKVYFCGYDCLEKNKAFK